NNSSQDTPHRAYIDRAQFGSKTAPRGLSPWSNDWQPDPWHREVIAATGLVPVERRLSVRPSIVAPRGQAPWRPIPMVGPVTGHQSPSHRDEPGGAPYCRIAHADLV